MDEFGQLKYHLRSPYLSCLDLFFWGNMKSIVYASPVNFSEDGVARIDVVVGDIQNMLGVYSNARKFLQKRCAARIVASVQSIEQFLRIRTNTKLVPLLRVNLYSYKELRAYTELFIFILG